MACGCSKPLGSTLTAARGAAAGSQVYHYVYLNGTYTGRRFTSILAARTYAKKVGGTYSTNAPAADGAPLAAAG